MKSPYFSINIPAYNCGKLILEALESVAKQSFQDWEVIVVDDGSSDETPAICQMQDIIPSEKFVFVRASHVAQYGTRERLHSVSSGKMIFSLDADDCLLDERALEKIYALQTSTDADVVLFNATRDIDSYSLFIDYGELGTYKGCFDAEAARLALYSGTSLNNICCKAYKSELMSFGGTSYEIYHSEDRLQCAELLEAVSSVALINEPLYYYRPNPSSVTNAPYRLSSFEDALLVENLMDSLSAGRYRNMLARRKYLAQLIAYNLQPLHDSLDDKKDRLAAYCKIHEACCSADAFPDKGVGVRPRHKLAYDLLISEEYEKLDFLLGLVGAARNLLKGKS